MADKEQLELLRNAAAWNRWRVANPSLRPDLFEADLCGALLHDADLRAANLREADLSNVDLSGADLSGADMSGADLHHANLRGAKLFRTDLSGAELAETDLTGANLRGTLLDRTHLDGAMLRGAVFAFTILVDLDLRRTLGLEEVRHAAPSRIGTDTLARSAGEIAPEFLRGAGLPEPLISWLPKIFGACDGEYYSCFISYDRSERAFADLLVRSLRARGIHCWIDTEQVFAGERILNAIDEGIRLWDKVLVCCSQSSLRSPWVLREIDKGLAKEEQLHRSRGYEVLALVPLNLDGYLTQWEDSRGSILRDRHAENFVDWRNPGVNLESRFERLARALRADPKGRPRPPEPRL